MTKEEIIKPENLVYKKPTLMNDNPMHYQMCIRDRLYNHALAGDADCGGLISYNYISGEPVTGLADGRPLFVQMCIRDRLISWIQNT